MHKAIAMTVALGAALLSGCANDGGLLSTGALATASVAEPAQSKQPAVDPQCVALLTRIEALRKEGTPERIEKVAAGESATAQVKRASLSKIVELDKANADYQARCSTLTPQQQAAAAAQAASATTAVATAAATTKPAKKKSVVAKADASAAAKPTTTAKQ